MSNWRSRLTCVAWAAPAAALCALVTRDQQCSLAKVASGSAVAERTYVSHIECGRWTSLPEEASRPRACLRLRTHGGSGPASGGVSVPSPLRGPDSIWGSGTPWEVRGPRLFGRALPSPGHVVTPDPSPSGTRVRDHWSSEMESDPRGPAGQLKAPLSVVTHNYTNLYTYPSRNVPTVAIVVRRLVWPPAVGVVAALHPVPSFSS